MLLVVHRSNPTVVFATHSDRQIDEIEVAYPDSDYEIWRVAGTAACDDTVPSGGANVRPFAANPED